MVMYVTYCASCHGDAARGDGPAAPGLRSKPVDLTLLSKRNNGVFPKDQVRYILTTSERMPNHGAATMPSWNDAFHALDGGHLRTPVACLRVYNLLNYLEKVQAPGR
jgi:mono/diheme cytochrome c family protein